MAETDVPPKFEERKPGGTITLSHKQVGWGTGGLTAALVLVSQLSARYTPVEKTQAQDQQIATISISMDSRFAALKSDMQTAIAAQTTALTQTFKESQVFTKAVVDAQGKRIDDTVSRLANLEFYSHDRKARN